LGHEGIGDSPWRDHLFTVREHNLASVAGRILIQLPDCGPVMKAIYGRAFQSSTCLKSAMCDVRLLQTELR
jgi:hypothetical protein